MWHGNLDQSDPDNEGVVLKVEHDGLLVLFIKTPIDTGDHIEITRLKGGDGTADLVFAVPSRLIDTVIESGHGSMFKGALVKAAIAEIHNEIDRRKIQDIQDKM